jgi:putative ABC transport system permease protein
MGDADMMLVQNIRHAARALAKNRTHTVLAVAMLALGIGVNTAMFSVINAVLLRESPYREPDRLVTIRQKFPLIGDIALATSPAEYIDYRDRTRVFSSIAGYEDLAFDLTGASEPLRVQAHRVTHTLFETLGVAPIAGRTFSAAEDRPAAERVAVLSYAFWQRRFGSSLRAIGTVVRLNEQPYTLIGIMPPGFEFPFTPASVGEPPALWVPMAFTPREIQDRAADFPVHIVARLRPDVSLSQAHEDIARVATEFQRERADIYSGNLRLQVDIEPFGAAAAARVRPMFLMLAAAVAFVLLIACANVTNLLLARGAVRQREMAVRTALGASARQLMVLMVIEGLLLAVAGGALGCGLAAGLISLVRNLSPSFVAGLANVRLDLTVLIFTVVISVITALLCSVAPAITWTRPDVNDHLKLAGRQAGSLGRGRIGRGLVVLEAASAVILLIGAGLLLHSFVEVLRVPPGFSSDGVVVARTTFNRQRYPSNDRRRAAERLMVERLAAIPSVTTVALTTHLPLADERQIGFILENQDIRAVKWANNALVSGEYFGAMGIPLRQGRTFTADDTPDAPLSAIVNEAMARQYWPQGDALGKRLVWGGRKLTIIGVVGDVHIESLDAGVNPTIYTSVYQIESGATTSAVFILRSRLADPAALATSVREAIWSVDRDVPVYDIRRLSDIVARSLAARQFALVLLLSFAALALGLAVLGLYGVLSHAVAQRTPELGVRLALGATPARVLRLVVGDGVRLTVAGIALGGILGSIVARAMSRLLFGIAAFDPITFAGAAGLLLVVALLASFVPARRAAHVDPLLVLRSE